MKATDRQSRSLERLVRRKGDRSLLSTLAGYEVEELTGQDLRRILPEIIVGEGPATDRLLRSHEKGRGARVTGDADLEGVELRKDRRWDRPMV